MTIGGVLRKLTTLLKHFLVDSAVHWAVVRFTVKH